MAEVRERPILFSAPMVRALLAGTKTQTRRAAKLPHANPLGVWEPGTMGGPSMRTRAGDTVPEHPVLGHSRTGDIIGPRWMTGDRLYVRETWMDLLGTGIERKTGDPGRYVYAADTPPGSYGDEARKDYGLKWKPSIHMPRKASRILLDVTEVRVQRLQEISHEDAEQEGVKCDMSALSFRDHYAALWDRINGAGSWDMNPWVWAVSFKRISP